MKIREEWNFYEEIKSLRNDNIDINVSMTPNKIIIDFLKRLSLTFLWIIFLYRLIIMCFNIFYCSKKVNEGAITIREKPDYVI